MHTSDSIFSVGSTKNVSHQSHLTRLWQHLMAQAESPANLLKKNLISRCVNLIAGAPGLLATVAPEMLSLPGNLTPASGCQDHTILPYASGALVSRTLRVHRSPSRVCDDRERPSSGTGWRKYATDLGQAASKILKFGNRSKCRRYGRIDLWSGFSSWLGSSRPSTFSVLQVQQDVDARVKPGHDNGRNFSSGKPLDSIYPTG